MVEQKHTWHWANQAITLAHTTGLHRVAANTPQRRLWTRIWWTCLVRDRVIGLGTGRPMQISSLDCSTPMLTMDDLKEVGDTEQDRSIKIMFIEFVKLCQYMEGVLSLQHPTVTISTGGVTQEQVILCDETLQFWVDNLAPEAKCQEEPLDVTGRPNIATMYRALLHLMHRYASLIITNCRVAKQNCFLGLSLLPFISHSIFKLETSPPNGNHNRRSST